MLTLKAERILDTAERVKYNCCDCGRNGVTHKLNLTTDGKNFMRCGFVCLKCLYTFYHEIIEE